MKKIALSSLLILSIAFMNSCKEDILDESVDANAGKNVFVDVYFYWDGDLFEKDSTYFVPGAFVQFDEVSVLFSNTALLSEGDSLDIGDFSATSTLSNGSAAIGFLEPMAYSGDLYINAGLDSLASAIPPAASPEGSAQEQNPGLYRGNLQGYNFLVISGRYKELTDTTNAEPSIPFRYVLGTNEFHSTFTRQANFLLENAREAHFPATLDISKLMIYDPTEVPFIYGDPTDNDDFTRAQNLHSAFEIDAFEFDN
ncbi:MAG: hypothetical protein SchgKO_14530 [Schleiferiaceae bacterium]